MSTDTSPLSPRHERFVAEYLKDGNATQAYIRAGYSPRGAQPSASRLLRDPRIEAAIAAGRQQMAQALEVTVERIAQEYAKIAFASIDDFVSLDADGRLQVDLTKASQAQRAGIVELSIATHRNGEQRVSLKLGKLQALAALTKQIGVLVVKPVPGLTAEDRERYEERCAADERSLNHRDREQRRVEAELREARAALEEARLKLSGQPDHSNPESRQCEPDTVEAHDPTAPPPVKPGMAIEPLADHTPGVRPNAAFLLSFPRQRHVELDAYMGGYEPYYQSEEVEELTRELEAWIRGYPEDDP